MIRAAAALLLAALIPQAGAGAQGAPSGRSIRGVVVDATTGAPVVRARIEAFVQRTRTDAGADGAFSLIAAQPDTLLVRAIGYRQMRVAVPGPGEPLRIGLTPAPLRLSDIVVTTSRRPERAGESPIPVTSVSDAEISASAAPSADRMLAQIPGLQVLPSQPTGADLSIRGINGARVLVLQDGEPVAGGLLENRDLSRLSSAGLQRIEVVKGPLSALYGSDALGGVVNLVSRDPAGPLTFGAEARAGDAGRREARLEAESGEGRLAGRVDGAWREDRRVPSITTATSALARVWNFRGTVRARASSTLHLRADASLFRERQRWQVSSDGFNGFNDNQGASGWLEAVYAPNVSGTWRARLYGEEYTHRFRQAREPRPLASDTAPTQREQLIKGRLGWSASLGGHRLDAGLDLVARSIEAPGKVDGVVSDRGAEGYLQDSWTAGRLLLTPATRLSWNSRWGRAVTPSIAGAFDVSPSLRLRAGAARGFRGPSFKELAWDFPNPFAGYAIRGNPDLRPERSWQWSAGGAWSVFSDLVADVEVYRNDLADLIELTQTGSDPGTGLLVFSSRNVARARTQGIELGLRWNSPGWYAGAEYSRLDARDRNSGRPLDRRAPESARLRAGGSFPPLRALRADVTLSYTGRAPARQLDGSMGHQSAFLSSNMQVQYELPGGIGLSVGGDNLFNATPSGWTGILGRRVYAGIRGTWRP